jgi:hypothetical protein
MRTSFAVQGILRLKRLPDGGQARRQAFRCKDLQANPCRAVQISKLFFKVTFQS